ncbi:hypothetical protein QBC38DRAFT_47832 [Podospora fimiseda]|uniref:Uncharacterized protein n=1 Tax=Podospora fimiseda TaxID=252190 RepID=A0AAN7H6T9_9PEZI|nr:hypothetical protein QBC38DRAFT_47832 [Podospora fimiseda]
MLDMGLLPSRGSVDAVCRKLLEKGGGLQGSIQMFVCVPSFSRNKKLVLDADHVWCAVHAFPLVGNDQTSKPASRPTDTQPFPVRSDSGPRLHTSRCHFLPGKEKKISKVAELRDAPEPSATLLCSKYHEDHRYHSPLCWVWRDFSAPLNAHNIQMLNPNISKQWFCGSLIYVISCIVSFSAFRNQELDFCHAEKTLKNTTL